VGKTILKLVLVPASERELENVYRPFVMALNSTDQINKREPHAL
jgi:hypothetical protein